MKLDGETLVTVIIGDPIAQVKSPALVTANMQARGVNGICIPGHVLPKDVPAFMDGVMTQKNLAAIVANPADLLGPRGESEIDSTRRTNVINDWQEFGSDNLPLLFGN